jgi:hypothetical protein
VNQNAGEFPYLKQDLLRISKAKIKERISAAPNIARITRDRGFDKILSEVKEQLENDKLISAQTDFLPILKAENHEPFEEFISS